MHIRVFTSYKQTRIRAYIHTCEYACMQAGGSAMYTHFSNYDSLSVDCLQYQVAEAIVVGWECCTVPSCFLDKGAPLKLPRVLCV